MSVMRNGSKCLRDGIYGAAAAVAAATALASCAAAGAGAGTPGASQQAGSPVPGRASSLTISGDLSGVAALSAGDVWAVGSTDASDPMTVHWNGSAWTEKVLPLGKGQPGDPPGGFDAVAAVSPDDVWAVGVNAGDSLVEHWNGRAWAVVTAPSAGPQFSGTGADLYGVAAVSARDVWAVGGTNDDRTWIIHWNGTAWTRVPSPSPAGSPQLTGVAVATARSAWAVGSYTSPVTGRSLPLIEHWDGHAWTLVPSPVIQGGAVLMGVAVASPDSAWAVGGHGTAGGSGGDPLIEHWDGRAWARVPSPHLAGGGTLNAVTSLSPTDAWAVGSGILRPGKLPPTTVIEHWDGRTWTLVPSPDAGDLTGVTAASPSSAWAVGSASGGGGPVAVIEHWDGKAWTWPVGSCASLPDPNCPEPATQSPGGN
jgi:hypothetical protein